MRSDKLVEIQSTQTQKDFGKLLTFVLFQQFVNTRFDVECLVLDYRSYYVGSKLPG
jgi:hypothetical protein